MMNDQERRTGEPPTIGRRLKQVREERRLSLAEVERAIKVRVPHLEALEEGNPDALPAPEWMRGFLILYAKYLGLDDEYAQELGLSETVRGPGGRRSTGRELKGLSRVLRRPRFLIAASAVVIALSMIVSALIAPYGTLAGRITDFASGVIPGTFLDSGPQRILVLPSSGGEGARADNAIIVKVAEDSLGLLSVPRNTITEIPDGHGRGELARAFELGGADLTRRTVAGLTDLEIPNYLTVDTAGTAEIVDAMGGVRVAAPSPSGAPEDGVSSGSLTLTGEQAVAYLEGEGEKDDIARAQRQQNFLNVMFQQALAPSNLVSNPTTLGAVLEHTETNMSGIQVIQLASRIQSLKGPDLEIEAGTIPGEEDASAPQSGDRAGYWLPDARELPAVLEQTVR